MFSGFGIGPYGPAQELSEYLTDPPHELRCLKDMRREKRDRDLKYSSFASEESWKDQRELVNLKEMRRRARRRDLKYPLLEIIALEGRHEDSYRKRQKRRRADGYRCPDRESPQYWTDLHGFYLKEACRYVDEVLEQSMKKGARSSVFIVGLGIHSPGRKRVLGPRIQDYLERNCGGRAFTVRQTHLDHPCPGCLTVYF